MGYDSDLWNEISGILGWVMARFVLDTTGKKMISWTENTEKWVKKVKASKIILNRYIIANALVTTWNNCASWFINYLNKCKCVSLKWGYVIYFIILNKSETLSFKIPLRVIHNNFRGALNFVKWKFTWHV